MLRSFNSFNIVHNTVVGNAFSGDADGGAGGITAGPFGGPSRHIRNNIIVGNRWGINCLRCDERFSSNLVWGNTTDYRGMSAVGTDIAADPRFIDPSEQDYRLTAESPCIDRATGGAVETDFAGSARPSGEGRDIGAFELVIFDHRLVITEVMANPLDEGTGEFVELYNAGDSTVDVDGFVLSDGDADSIIEAFGVRGTEIDPGQYAVVLDRDYAADYTIDPDAVVLKVDGSRLGNALSVSDTVSIRVDASSPPLSTYSHPLNPGNGVSASRISIDAADAPTSWLPSVCGATPGYANCLAEPGGDSSSPLVITEVMANPLNEGTGEFVEIFNRSEEAMELTGLVLSDGDEDDVLEAFGGSITLLQPGNYAVVLDESHIDDYTIPPAAVRMTVGDARLGNSLSVSDPVTLRTDDGELLGSYAYPFDPGNGISAELISLELGDVPGNWLRSPCEGEQSASPGAVNCGSSDPDVLILPTLTLSEVMANALDEDTGAFIELHNYGAVAVSAVGLVISDGDATDELLAWPGHDGMIRAGGWGLVLDPEYADDYDLPESVSLFRPDDTAIGSGLSTNDPIWLRARDGVTLVSTFGFPENPGNGRSMERVGDGADTADSWVASSCESLSSPGAWNCAAGEAPPADPVCLDFTLADYTVSEAEDYTYLLEVATTIDVPWAEVHGLLLEDCADPMSTVSDRRALADELWWRIFPYSEADLGAPREVGPWEPGVTRFIEMLRDSRVVLDELTDEGHWNPAANPTAAELYDQVDDLLYDLEDRFSDDPTAFWEVAMHLEASECSEDAVVVYDPATQRILYIREFGC